MGSEILIALLAFLGTIVGSGAGILASAKLTNFRLKQLEEKVKLHNSLVERLVVVEQTAKNNEHRISELEKGA